MCKHHRCDRASWRVRIGSAQSVWGRAQDQTRECRIEAGEAGEAGDAGCTPAEHSLDAIQRAGGVQKRAVPCRAVGAWVILRALFGGEIRLQPQADGGLLARWNHSPLRCIGPQGHVVAGAGLRIRLLSCACR